MAHILFADLSQAGLHTLRRAVDLGHTVTLIRGMAAQYYHEDAAFRRLVARVHQVVELDDTARVDELTAAIAGIHAARPVDAVISQCDPMLEALAEACERLSLRYTGVAGMANARDKSRTRSRLAEVGLPSAQHAVAHTAADAVAAADRIGYPVVVKPVSGMDSILATRADDATAVSRGALAILAATSDQGLPVQTRALLGRGVLIEEHLVGELVSVEIGVLDGQAHRFLLCGRARGRVDDCVEIGAVLPAPMAGPEQAAAFDYAEAVCSALGLDFGIFHVEVVLTAHGPVLVEVNPRVMGGVMTVLHEILTGVDFADHVIDLHLGKPPRSVPVTGPRTITARRIMPDMDGTLGARIELGWVKDPGTGIVNFEDFGLRPGATVRERDVLGRFAVVGDTWLSAMEHADALLTRFGNAIGLPVIEPAPASALLRNVAGPVFDLTAEPADRYG